MNDLRIGWRFCPHCGVPWPMQRPERIRGRLMICGNCEERIPDISGWMEDCRAAVERVETLERRLAEEERKQRMPYSRKRILE